MLSFQIAVQPVYVKVGNGVLLLYKLPQGVLGSGIKLVHSISITLIKRVEDHTCFLGMLGNAVWL